MNIEKLEGIVINERADMSRERSQRMGDKAVCYISNFVEQMAAAEGKGLLALVRGAREPTSIGQREV